MRKNRFWERQRKTKVEHREGKVQFDLFQKNVCLHPPKILNDLFKVIFYFTPLFCRVDTFPPLFIFLPIFCISPIFVKFTRFLPTLHVFCFPLFWPWCIYASCYTPTGRPCQGLHTLRVRQFCKWFCPFKGYLVLSLDFPPEQDVWALAYNRVETLV